MRLSQSFAVIVLGIALAGGGFGQDLPPFLRQIIAEYESVAEGSDAEASPEVEIWQHEYQGKTVFYLPLSRTHCCDRLSRLFDSDGTLICMPDGGFTGRGDGRCPDFLQSRSRGVLVYGGPEAKSPPEHAEDGQRDRDGGQADVP
jgi:hypothetical protein